MDAQEKDLLVEIHVTSAGRKSNFTGYPVAPGRILTARHGLLLDPPATGRRIEVRWHEQRGGHRRRWRRACIAWESAVLDAAVLVCPFPAGLRDRFGLVSDRPLDDTMRWSSAGIATAGDKSPTASGSYDFQGNLYSAATGKTRFSLGIDDACDHHEWYEGASGMPVFVDHRIVGIAVARDPAAQTRRFEATPVQHMLADPDFCRVIRHHERQSRREAAITAIAALLEPDGGRSQHTKNPAAEATRVNLHVRLGCASANTRVVAEALVDSPLERALEALDKVLGDARPEQAAPQRGLVALILGEMLPAVYDPSAVAGTAQRHARPDAWLLELPAGMRTAGEVLMAGVRGRPAYFKPLADRGSFPEPRDLLPDTPEAGFDGDGQAQAADIERDLANLLGAGDTDAIEARLGRTFKPDREALVKDKERDRPHVRSMVCRQLETRAERERRFYYFLLDPAKNPRHGLALPTLKTLKQYYPMLDFAMLAFGQDLAVLDSEEARFQRLCYLLPCADDPSR